MLLTSTVFEAYHQKTEAQVGELERQIQRHQEKETILEDFKPALDCIGLEALSTNVEEVKSRCPRLDALKACCRTAWSDLKAFVRLATQATVAHVLSVVRSHYPSLRMEVVGTGFARGTDQ